MDSLSAGFRRFPGVVLLGIAFAIAYGGTAVSAPRSEGPARTYDYDAPAASETPTTNLRIDTSEARTGARASSGAVRLVVGRFHEVSYSFDPGANSTDLRAQRRSRSHGYDSPAATTTPAANLRIAALLANRHPAGNSLPSPLSLARRRATKGGLTRREARDIQDIVDEAGRPLEVVGSAASGSRRGLGSKLPIGKGPRTRSDIDYLVPPSSLPHFRGLDARLPSIDPSHGIIPGSPNPALGPSIRFEPRTR